MRIAMREKFAVFACLLFLCLTMLSFAQTKVNCTSAAVWTDKQSYSPGESATIFGSGFLDRSTINVEVVRPDLIVNRWNTSSDADGNFTTTYRLDGIVGTYNVTATDGTNAATTTFTDPTFGLTSIGSATCPTGTAGITSILSLSTSFGTGILQAQKITTPTGGATIKSVSINLKSVGSEFLNFALYTDSSGTPNTLVSASVTGPQTATLGWMTVTYATPFYVSSGSYWIAFQMQYGVSAVAYDTSGSNSRYYRGYAWGSFPSSFGSGGFDNIRFSLYVTYVQTEGYAKATKATLPDHANISSISFYSHATGNFRLAIYSGTTSPSSKLLETTSSMAATASAWNTVPISSFTPTSLSLSAGTYWLVWQWDAATSGPSYTAGSSGDGNYMVLAYGAFPASWSGGTSSSEKWSVYVTYTIQYQQTITSSPVTGSGYVTVDGGAVTTPYTVWWNSGSSHTIAAISPVTVVSGQSQYVWRSWSDSGAQSHSVAPTATTTYTANFKLQYYITFSQTGVGTDFTGTVFTLNGTGYGRSGNAAWWDSGDTIAFAYQSPLTVTANVKRYTWGSTSGTLGVTTQTGSKVVSGYGTVIGNYQTQFYITLSQTGVASDFSGTVVTVDGSGLDRSDHSFWWYSSSVHSFSFESPLVVNSHRYVWESTSGTLGKTLQSDSITVSGSGTVVGNYLTQYQVTFGQTGLDSTAAGTIVTVNETANVFSDLPYIMWVEYGSSVTYSYSDMVLSSESGRRFNLTGITGPTSPITVSEATTVTGNYQKQWNITLDQNGVFSYGGIVVIIDGENYGTANLSISLWWDDGSTHSFSFNSPLVVAENAKQYVWTNTTGISGSQSDPSFVASINGAITGNYKTQYYLSVTGGNSPQGDGWYDSGSSATASSTWIWNAVSGQSRTALTNWQLDSVDQNPTRQNAGNLTFSITMSAYHEVNFVSTAQYYLTVTGGNGIVYGTPSQTSDNWYDSGTSTTVSSDWVWNTVSGSRTAVTNYSIDGVDQNPARQGSGTLTTSSVDMFVYRTVAFASTTQYLLTDTLISGSVSSITPSPTVDSWYDDGTPVDVVLNYVWDAGASERKNLFSYTIDGSTTNVSRAGSGTFAVPAITMTAAHSISDAYVTQYYLTVDTSPSGIDSPSGEGWYDAGTYAPISTDQYVDIISGSRYRFDGWTTGDMGEIVDPSSTSTTVLVDSAKTVTANYVTQYYLTVDSAYDAPSGEGWYDSGVTANFSVTSPVSGGADTQYVCTGFTGDASGSGTSGSILMNNSKTLTFGWKTQYYLTVSSAHDTPSGEGWYDASDTAYASLSDGTVSGGVGTQYVFTGWSGDASGSGLTSDPITMDGPKTATANWKTQYYLTVDSAYDTPSGEGWYDSGDTAYASLSDGTVSGGTGIQYVFTGWSGDASGSSLTSDPLIMDGPKTATADWKTQYYLTVTSDHDTPSGEGWYDSGSTTYASLTDGVVSGGSGVRYVFVQWTGDASGSGLTSDPITMDCPKTATAAWKTQYYITFDQTGVGDDFSGVVLTINGTGYNIYLLPSSFWWDNSSVHSFNFESPLVVTAGEKRYVLTGVNETSGFIVSGSETIIGSYKTQYYVTFSQSGVGSDFSGTVVTVNGTDYDRLGFSAWTDNGDIYTFDYKSPLVTGGKRYLLTSVNETSGFTVSGPETIMGTYNGTQYLVSFTQSSSGVNPTVSYSIDNGSVIVNTVPFDVWVDNGSSIAYTYQSPVSGGVGIRYLLTDTSPASPQTITGNLTVTGTYKIQYKVSFTQTGSAVAPDVSYSVDGGLALVDTAPFNVWVDSGSNITYAYNATVPGALGVQYVFTGASPASPQTVLSSFTVTGTYKTQYYLTITSAHDSPSGEGWYDSGDTAYASLSNGTVSGGSGVQYVFTGWSGDASGSDLTSDSITMDSPKTATADWKTQYYLTVTSTYDSPSGQGWYDSDATANFSVTSPVSGGSGVQYLCTGYGGDASGFGASGSIIMNSSKTITFSWKTQYNVTFTQSGYAEIETCSAWGSDVWFSYTVDTNNSFVVLVVAGGYWGFSVGVWPPAGFTPLVYVEGPIGYETVYIAVNPSQAAGTYGVHATSGSSNTCFSFAAYIFAPGNYSFAVGSAGGWPSASLTLPSGYGYYIFGGASGFRELSFSVPADVRTLAWGYMLFSAIGHQASPSASVSASDFGVAIGGIAVRNLDLSASTGSIVTVNGTELSCGDLPYGFWADAGDTVSYNYSSIISSSNVGERFRLAGISGPPSPFTVVAPETIAGGYVTQYYLTVASSYDTPSGEGWYDSGVTAYAGLSDGTVSGGSGVQYVFTGWSDDASGSGLTSDPITMDCPKTATADWKTQYYLTVTSDHDTPSGEGWYDSGDTAYASLSEGTVSSGIGTQYVFTGWSGDASGSSLTSDPITMDGPKTATADWKTQYYLTVSSTHDSPSGEGWYDASDTAYASLSDGTVSGGLGIQYIFTGWSDDASGSNLTSDPITMDGPKTATADWKTQYYLTVDTSPPSVNSPSGEGWYDSGDTAHVSTDQYVDIVSGSSRYCFNSWTGASGDYSDATVYMNSAKTATANYVIQYYLTVETSPSGINSPSGEGWYDASSYAPVSTDSFFDVSLGVGYRFYNWSTVDMSEITDPSAASTTVWMDEPKTVTANYMLQYQVTFDYSVSGGSGYSAPTVSYFSLGVLQNVTAGPLATVWVDADSAYEYDNPLLGSNATERWMASPDPADTVSAPGTIDPEYWHQFYMDFEYHTSDGSSTSDPTVYYQQFGGPLSDTAGFSGWADAGSAWTYDNPTDDSTSTERWIASPDPAGTVLVSETIDPEYWHQFYMDFEYHTSDGSSTAGPNVDYQQFGGFVSDTAEFSDWADADSTWTYDNPTGDSTSSERWVAESTPTETVSAADTIDPEYWHQFYMTFNYYTSDGSSTVGPTVYYQQFDGDVSATAGFSDWADAGSVWSYDNPTDDSTSTERWIASSDPAGIVSVSETIDPKYWHQFYVSVSISTSDGSSVFPQFDYYQFGSSLADYGSFSDWMDVDSSWNIQAQVDISLTERYVLDPFEFSSGVIDTDSFSFDFWHQLYVSVSILTNDGSPAFPQFDYYQFGSPLAGYGSGGDWMDVGSSWNIQSQVDLSGTERYVLDPFELSSGVVDSTDLAFDFWHQLFVSVNVSTNDGSPAFPQFDYYQFGSSLADYGSFSDWMDVGSSWSIQSQVDVSGSERYMLDPFEFSSGVVDNDSFSFDFWHQYYVFVDISTNDGSPAFPQFDYYQFGVSQAGYGSFSDWMDVDSSWSIQTQVDISGSERYILDPFESSSGFIDSDSLPFDFWHQFYLTVETSPSGVNSPLGNGWYNAEDYASISTDQYVDIVSGSSRYNFTGWSTSDMGEIDDPLNISTMVYIDGAKTVTANYITQYYLTIDTSPSGVNSPFGQGWYDYGSSALISTDQYVDIVSGSSRYRFNGWTTGNMSEIDDPSATTTTVLMDSAKTVTAEYLVQYSITFDQTGVGFDFTGPVVNIDGADYGVASLPTLLWFDNASTHSFSYYSPLSVSSGKQYVWNSTSGISTLQDDTFAVSSSGSIVGNYKTQYYLTVNSAHDTPLGEGWYDSDSTANFSVSSPVSGGSGIKYVCTGYTGDASGSDASGSIVMNSSKTITFNWKTQYYVTFSQSGVGSDFSGTVVTVNGTDHDRLGFSAWTDNGDIYTFDYKSPLVTDGKCYVLTNVNETSGFTVSGPETITGFYNTTQYKVSFAQSGSSVNPTVSYQIDGGSVVVNTVPFDVWVNSGSNITYTYENPVSGGIGVQYVLIDTSPASSQTITGNLTVTGTYKTQFYLTVTSTHDSPTGEGWYDSGVLANFSVTSPVSGGFGVQYVCTGFTGDASGSGISGSVLMNDSNSVTFSWKTQFYLTVVSAYDTPLGEGWYDSGDIANFSVSSPAPGGLGVQYVCTGFTGDASGSGTSGSVTMNDFKTVTFTWKTQFYLTVASAHGTVGGQGWYDSGSIAYATVTPLIVSGPSDIQYAFTSWSGDASGSTSPSNSITMSGPKTATANWKTQYYLTVNSTHDSPSGAGWYDSGATAGFSVSSPTAGPTGVQYVCTGFTGDASGSGTSGSILMDGPKLITFTWKTQYYLTVSSAHDTPLGQGWYDSGVLANFSVSSPVSGGSGIQYVCTGYTGDASGSGMSGSITMSEPKMVTFSWKTQYYLTVSSAYDLPTPLSGWFDSGSSITESVTSPVSGGAGTRFVCTGWSGTGSVPSSGSASSVTFSITTPSSIIWNWKTQYYLTVTSLHDSPVGEGWYDSGSTAGFSVTSPVSGGTGIRYVCTGFAGDASGSGASGSILMNNPKSITFTWKTQYYLTVTSLYDTPSGEGWYDSASVAHASIASGTISGGVGIQYVFTQWSGDASGTGLTSDPITMNGPKTAIADWKTQYYLTVTSPHDSPTPLSGWFDSGSSITESVTSPISGVIGTRYVCTGWAGTGSVPASGSASSVTFTITTPSSINWNWKTQYYLTVNSAYDTPTGQGWYDAASTAGFSVSSPASGGSGIQYVCTGFTGDASGSGTSGSILMSSPKSITFTWKTQYYLTVSSSHDTPTGEGWYDTGSTADFGVTSPVSGGSGVQYVCTGFTGDAFGFGTSGSILMDGPKTVTFSWKTQYYLIVSSAYNSPTPSSGWFDSGSSINASVMSPVAGGSGVQYVCTGWIGTGSVPASGSAMSVTFTIGAPSTITWNWKTQYQVTFYQTGVSSDFAGTVVTVGGVNYGVSGLPVSFWWDQSSSHSFSFDSTLVVNASKQYSWDSTFGLSTLQSETLTITVSGSVVGNYIIQNQITFDQVGVSSDFTGTVIIIDSVSYSKAQLPVSFSWSIGSSHSFAFQSPLVVSASSKQYVWTGTTGLSSSQSDSITVTSYGSIIGHYETQYYLTVTSPHDSPTPLSGWFDSGSSITESVTSPVSGVSGIQYVCTGWTGGGSVPASGSTSSVTFTITAPSSITWNWETQYYLTVNSAHDTPTGQGWYDVSSTAGFSVSSPVSGGLSVQYVCTGFTGDASGSGTSGFILMNSPKSITFTWNTQYYLTVSSAHDSPSGQGWYDSGATAGFGVTSPVSGGSGVRYVCTGFTGDASGSGTSGSILMNSPKAVTFTWKTQYYLTVSSSHDTPTGEGWYNAGSTADFGVTSPVSGGSGVQYICTGFTGDASGSGTNGSITMSNPKTVTFSWKTQYYLTVNSPYDTPLGEGWYDSSSTAYASLTEGVVSSGSGTRYVFTAWSDDASGTGLTSDPITMDGPKTAIAEWIVQYYLTVNSTYDSPSGQGWYDSGATADFSVSSPVMGSVGVRYVCTGYDGDASGSGTGGSIIMDCPKTVTFMWKVQYYLTVTSVHDTPSGEGWYDAASVAYASLSTGTVSGETGTRYVFARWTGDASGINLVSNPITMDGPKTAIAYWTAQYRLVIQPSADGTTSPASDTYWYDEGTTPDVTANSSSGYVFDRWVLDGSDASTNSTIQVLMNQNHTLQPLFTKLASVTFRAFGVSSDALSWGLTVDSTFYSYTSLPITFIWPIGSVHTYSFSPLISSTVQGKRFSLVGVDGPGSPLTVTADANVTGNYKVQFYLTVNSAHDTPSGEGWYDSDSIAYASLSTGTVSGGAGVRYVFTGWSEDASGSSLTSSPITMDWPKTATADWKTQFYLTVSSLHDSPSGQDWYAAGATANFSVSSPAAGSIGVQYICTGYSGDASGSETEGSIVMSAAKTVTFNWKTQYYLTIVSTYGSPSGEGWYDEGSTAYATLSNGTVLVSGTMYKFTGWSNDASGTGLTSDPIIMDSFKMAKAVWTAYYSLTITVAPVNDGTTNPVAGQYTYSQGTEIQVTATPNDHYAFAYWLLDGVEYNGTSITITMDSDHNLQAIFTLEQLTLTINTSTGGTTEPGPGVHVYDYGTNVSLTATPNEGYNFSYWLLDGVNVTDNPITVTVDGDHSLQAVFTTTKFTLNIPSTTGGTTNPLPGNYTYDYGTNVTLTATPSSGYVFKYWLVDGNIVENSSITIGIDSNHTIRPVFEAQPFPWLLVLMVIVCILALLFLFLFLLLLLRRKLDITTTVGGTTHPKPGAHRYLWRKKVEITSTPYSGYSFSHWVLDGEVVPADRLTKDRLTVIMNRNHTVQAVFFKLETVFLNNMG